MKRIVEILAWALLTLQLTSCATNRAKTLFAMGAAALVAGTVGALTSPKDERAEGHSLMWSGLGASAAGVTGLFIFDEEAKSEELGRKNTVLMKSLNALDGGGEEGAPKLTFESPTPLGKDVPPEYKSLVRPGKWSVYQLNRWILSEENTLIHQDKMIQLEAPSFSSILSPNQKQEEVKNEPKP